ncbi:hypothetical protein [Ligilactobacillus equi]|nr:hypothetical protein [Ligilactobacillus equi]
MTKTRQFWTFISFLTFLLFVMAIFTKMYWVNIFVIILGLLVNKKGSNVLFPGYLEKKRKAKKQLKELRELKKKY